MTEIEKDIMRKVTRKTMKKLAFKEICFPEEYSIEFRKNSNALKNIKDTNLIESEIESKLEEIMQREKNVQESLESGKAILNSVSQENLKNDEFIKKIYSELSEISKKLDSISEEVFRDELTNTYNRKWLFQKVLSNNIFNKDGLLVFIDLNKFKLINDVYGHTIGDRALIIFADFISQEFRDEKVILVRYAGDEFLLFFDNSFNMKKIRKMLEESREKLKRKKLRVKKDNKDMFSIDFSFGVSYFKHGDDFETVLNDADKKMYRMKDEIKNI